MKTHLIALMTIASALALSGCIGNADLDLAPGGGGESGREIRITMWVADIFKQEIYPGFEANLWAFCAEATDPNDQASVAAVEYWAPPPGAGETGTYGSEYDERCSVPGPTLRVQEGDRVIVDFVNDHFHCHTIHWHGQYVPWESDGVQGVTQDSVCTGESFTYDFVAERAGTLWYHCHVDVQFHVMQGLYGAMIVEPKDKELEPKNIDKEYVFVYSTLRRELVEQVPGDTNPHDDHGDLCGGTSGTPDCKNPAVDVTPDTWLLNGQSLPNTMSYTGQQIDLGNGVMRDTGSQIHIAPGERVRVRILNAGETVEAIHPHGHDMLVTHKDGNPLHPNARFYADTLLIGPAERYDVVIEGREGAEGAWVMHSHVEDHVSNDGQAPGGAFTWIVYPGYEDKLRTFLAELPGGRPYQAPVDLPDDVLRSARLGIGTGGGDASWDFAIDEEYPCAVKQIRFSATLQSATNRLGAGLPVGTVSIVVSDMDGNQVANLALSDTDRHGEWIWQRDTKSAQHAEWTEGGTFDVQVTGSQTIDAEVDVGVFIDYDDNEAEAFEERACGFGPGGHAH